MEHIHKNILNLKNIVQNSTEDNKDFKQGILEILENLVNKIEEIQVNVETLDENLSLINDDLSEVQDELFEEMTLEELEEHDDEYKEVVCKNCNKTLYVEKSVIDNVEDIPCPYCNKNFKI